MKKLLQKGSDSCFSYFKFMLFIGLTVLVTTSCKHEPVELSVTESPAFEFKKSIGMWVPYEYVIDDTTVVPGPFTTMSIFGAYAESVEIRADSTFVPAVWFNSSTIIKSETEGGPVIYNSASNELHFDNPFHFKGIIRKFDGKQLWVKTSFGLYKFEKKG